MCETRTYVPIVCRHGAQRWGDKNVLCDEAKEKGVAWGKCGLPVATRKMGPVICPKCTAEKKAKEAEEKAKKAEEKAKKAEEKAKTQAAVDKALAKQKKGQEEQQRAMVVAKQNKPSSEQGQEDQRAMVLAKPKKQSKDQQALVKK